MNESKPKKKYNKSDLIYKRLSFHIYNNDQKFDKLSTESKYSFLLSFYDDLENLIKMKPTSLRKKVLRCEYLSVQCI